MAQTKIIKISVKRFILVITLSCIMVSSTVGYLAYAASSNYYQVITGGQYPGAPSFSIYEQDGVYYAKNAWGGISFASKNCSETTQQAINSLPSGGIIKLAKMTATDFSVIISTRSINIIGDGGYNTNVSSPTNKYAITVTNQGYLTISGIYFNSGYGIDLDGTAKDIQFVNIHDCIFWSNNIAINIRATSPNWVSETNIQNCIFAGIKTGQYGVVIGNGTGEATGTYISGNSAFEGYYAAPPQGVGVAIFEHGRTTTIIGNRFELLNTSINCINSPSRLVIVNNKFPSDNATISGALGDECQISGNTHGNGIDTIIPLVQKTFYFPTNGGWVTSNSGSGSEPSQRPNFLYLSTGTSPYSLVTAYAKTLGLTASNPSGVTMSRIDWSHKITFQFTYAQATNVANSVSYIALKDATTTGDLATKGIGVKISNGAVTGQSFGTELGTIDMGTVPFGQARTITIISYPRVSAVYFYVDNTLIGNLTGNYVPSSWEAVEGAVFISTTNNDTAEDVNLYVGSISVTQDYYPYNS